MTDHDALCPRADIGYLPNVACWCDEIAKVRRDERGRVLREAREAVVAEVGPGSDAFSMHVLGNALNAIDRLVQEAP